jgi:predicted enzyme related to lactoylglutathione lyase
MGWLCGVHFDVQDEREKFAPLLWVSRWGRHSDSLTAVRRSTSIERAEHMVKALAFTVYPVKDLVRARLFYEQALGLTPAREFQQAWIEYDVGGGAFAITSMMQDCKPSDSAGGVAFEVDDVDHVAATFRQQGARVKVEPFSTPICRMAVLIDPEGNALTLPQAIQSH